ncbi:hypothetical protein BVI1335_2340007 [Burkholderia vietnamiensis]|nr:hypothetical protein BVI1335_2340007 [Burkholderia vietnamiensis]
MTKMLMVGGFELIFDYYFTVVIRTKDIDLKIADWMFDCNQFDFSNP